jgi:DNA-binding CsgD family transcriptional regulator
MHDTTERSSRTNYRSPMEELLDPQPNLPPSKPNSLERIAYPTFTLYVSETSMPPSIMRGRSTRQLPREIQYVESEEGWFEVNMLRSNSDYQSSVQTLSLLLGGLGKTVRAIAEELEVPYPTARTHRQNMLTNIGAVSMRHASRIAFDTGRLASMPGEQYRRLEISPHNLRILDALSQGDTLKQAGQKFHISPFTVKTHLQYIYAENGLHDGAHAVMRACLAGQLPLEQE